MPTTPQPTSPGPGLLAASASEQLSVSPGIPMGGYVERQEVAAGIHDALRVTAVAFRLGGAVAVVAGVDLLAVDAALTAEVASKAGLPEGCLLLAASHTHSGPDGIISRPMGSRVDPAYRAHVVEVVTRCVASALGRLEPARVRLSRSEVTGVAANRNLAEKPVDHRITSLVVERPDRTPVAIMLHFPCHPTVLGPENLQISADFPGALREHVRAEIGADAACMLFLNGASGDVSTRFTRRAQDFSEVERLAGLLGTGAAQGLAQDTVLNPDHLRTQVKHVVLPAKVIPAMPAAQATLFAAEEELGAAREQGAGVATLRRLTTKLQGATAEFARASGAGLLAAPVTLTAIRLGNVAFLGISAEVSYAIGAAIEKESPFSHTVVVGLSNGYCGYITDRDDYGEATYESLSSPFGPASAVVLAREAISLLRDLR